MVKSSFNKISQTVHCEINMNFKFIFMFCIFQTIEVMLLMEDGFECVKRKSGACKAFNVSEDFDHFIDLKALESDDHLSTIIEIDYMDNKYSYELKQNKNKKVFDTIDNPVVEILFSEQKNSEYSYRLVLGEKLNRLAYLEIVDDGHAIKYNNYSPDLPSWPFAVNVTIGDSKLMVHTRDGDGFDKPEPFLMASSDEINVRYLSVRNRNKNVKLVCFYDCSTKYGSHCGTEKTETIADCKAKFSPLGSGFFNTFINMSQFNRLGKEKTDARVYEYNEIFGIYRRNNDSCVILFSTWPFEHGTYVRITIGDDITVRVRTFNKDSSGYYEKNAVKKGWNQEPSDPNFIRINISAVAQQISIYNLHATGDDKPILTMKLCNYFERDTIKYMSVTSNRFKTVDLYYDCCLPNELEDCHGYEKNDTLTQIDAVTTIDDNENMPTTTPSEENTTFDFNETDVTKPTEYQEITTETSDIQVDDDDVDYDAGYEEDRDEVVGVVKELKMLKGARKTKTFLDTSNFTETGSTQYVYANGTSMTDYCPSEIEAGVELQEITEAPHTDEEEPVHHSLSLNALLSLTG